MHTIRVALVDDHALFRHGIRSLLREERGIEVVAEGESGEDAIRIAREQEPHVLLLDLDMPGMSGLEATRQVLASGARTRVLILTMHSEDPFPRRLLESGALGYLSKGCPAAELVTAIQKVALGRRYLQAELAQEMALRGRGQDASPFTSLSRRELDITLSLIRGLNAKTISRQTGLSVKTISTYKLRMYDKLAIKSLAELARLGILHSLLPSTEVGSLTHLNEPLAAQRLSQKLVQPAVPKESV